MCGACHSLCAPVDHIKETDRKDLCCPYRSRGSRPHNAMLSPFRHHGLKRWREEVKRTETNVALHLAVPLKGFQSVFIYIPQY